jgi:hypothetical protein
MIKNVIDLLQIDEYYGTKNWNINFAKGMYSIPKNWKESQQLIKRLYHG